MSPRAHNRLKPKPPDADADYIRAWNEGWEAGFNHACHKVWWFSKKENPKTYETHALHSNLPALRQG